MQTSKRSRMSEENALSQYLPPPFSYDDIPEAPLLSILQKVSLSGKCRYALVCKRWLRLLPHAQLRVLHQSNPFDDDHHFPDSRLAAQLHRFPNITSLELQPLSLATDFLLGVISVSFRHLRNLVLDMEDSHDFPQNKFTDTGIASLLEMQTGLTRLVLRLNDLELPAALSGLKHIEELTCWGMGGGTRGIGFIGRLTTLRRVELSGYRTSWFEVPESTSALGSLKSLRLRGFRSLPSSLGELSLLQELSLQCGRVRSVPESLSRLKQLETLFFENIQCSTVPLPVSLEHMPRLISIKIEGCNNVELPASFWEPPEALEPRLKILVLHDTKKKLPEQLRNLSSSLTELNICGYQHWIPHSLGRLSRLTNLSLDHLTECAYLPPLKGLTVLRLLSISNCNALRSLPEDLGALAQLSDLRIEFCEKLEELPDSIGKLQSLRLLLLDNLPQVTRLPSTFTALKNVDEVFIESCERLLT